MSKRIVELGRNGWRAAEADDSGVLVDAADCYRASYSSAAEASRYILVSGWQFDSAVPLLRGDDAPPGTEVRFLHFLNGLCALKPELHVDILAWDFHMVLAAEREWMQRIYFDWMTSPRFRFLFDDCPVAGGSHHQKFAVFDGTHGYLGGMDVCVARRRPRHRGARRALRRPLALRRWRSSGPDGAGSATCEAPARPPGGRAGPRHPQPHRPARRGGHDPRGSATRWWRAWKARHAAGSRYRAGRRPLPDRGLGEPDQPQHGYRQRAARLVGDGARRTRRARTRRRRRGTDTDRIRRSGVAPGGGGRGTRSPTTKAPGRHGGSADIDRADRPRGPAPGSRHHPGRGTCASDPSAADRSGLGLRYIHAAGRTRSAGEPESRSTTRTPSRLPLVDYPRGYAWEPRSTVDRSLTPP